MRVLFKNGIMFPMREPTGLPFGCGWKRWAGNGGRGSGTVGCRLVVRDGGASLPKDANREKFFVQVQTEGSISGKFRAERF